MSVQCNRGCGRETNSPSGVCAVCTLEDKYKEKFLEEEDMGKAKAAKEKICIDCSKPYKPTSNAQRRCPPCKAEHIKKYMEARRKDMRKPKHAVRSTQSIERSQVGSFAGMVEKAQELIVEIKTKCDELERLFE